MRPLVPTLLSCLFVLTSCAERTQDDLTTPDTRAENRVPLEITCWHPSLLKTRSADPDETLITDINLFIFNEEGLLEEQRFLRGRKGEQMSVQTSLLKDVRYTLCACANFSFPLNGIRTLDDLRTYRFYLAYPDEYSRGMPMTGMLEGIQISEPGSLSIPLERMMAKVSLRIDRSRLDSGVRLYIRSVEIGNCPRSACLFGESAAQGSADTFPVGFLKTYREVDALNTEDTPGMSREVSVYLLENIQQELHPTACSYIEIKAEYYSADAHTEPGNYLIYRFYIGESEGSYSLRRNCHYHFTVFPEGNGMNGDAWHVDRSGLTSATTGSIRIMPSGFIVGKIGEEIHVWAEFSPQDAPFDIGMEELEFDRGRGIYDYRIDEDGHGVTLTLRKSGSGILYMEAGAPVNDAAMAIVLVE